MLPGGPTSRMLAELTGTGIEDQAGDLHAVDVRHRDGRQAARRDQRGNAEAENDGVGLGDLQRVVKRVDCPA